jgi:hypothetical protein
MTLNKLAFWAVLLITSLTLKGVKADDKTSVVAEIDKKIAAYKLTEASKAELLKTLRQHILSYAHLESKAALNGLADNLYFRLGDDSISQLDDIDFFNTLIKEFAKEKDSHTRAYYPDYLSCRQASIPIEFRFYRDSDKDDAWGKVIVYEIKNDQAFKGISVGDELLQYGDAEIKPLFEQARSGVADSVRGFWETYAGYHLSKIDGRYSMMPGADKLYLAFKDYRSGATKEIEVPWEFDYTKCSDVALYKGLQLSKDREPKVPSFVLKSRKYEFEKIENPDNAGLRNYSAGLVRERGSKDNPTFGIIKFFDFQTYEDKKANETVNEYMDKTLISLVKLMNIFGDKKIKGLIIDTRFNNGGWIEFAHHIARVFSISDLNSVLMQFANGDMALAALDDEVSFTEKEIKKINDKKGWSGFPYSRNYFNWENYRNALLAVKGTSLRTAVELPHFKAPAQGLNPLSAESDFPKSVLTDQSCISSCEFFDSLIKDNGLGTLIGEKTTGAGGMVNEVEISLEGLVDGKKKVASKFPFRYAYTNVLTPKGELIEDMGVKTDIYMRPSLENFRAGEEDTPWIDKAITAMTKKASNEKTKGKKNQ